MNIFHSTATLLEVIRGEGLAAVRNRILDLLAERRRIRGLRRIEPPPPPPHGDAGIVNLSPIPPYPRRGGSQIQMLDRLEIEEHERSVALAYPHAGSWRVECRRSGSGTLFELAHRSGSGKSEVKAVVESMLSIARAVGAHTVHLENVHGLPLATAPELRARGLGVITSVHDFSCWCSRPHLVETPANVFCDFCADDARCTRCLDHDGEHMDEDPKSRRAAGARILAESDVVIFPSRHHLEAHEYLFPDAGQSSRWLVIEPASRHSPLAPTAAASTPHLAMVGGIKVHKGGALLAAVNHKVQQQLPGLRCSVWGDGDRDLLQGLKQQTGVRIRGYYRAGDLPAQLRAAGVTVALFPSVWPESYGLVVDECLVAGIPVVAFDHGAVGERLRRLNAGRLLPRSATVDDLALAVAETLRSPPHVPGADVLALPTPAAVATRYLELYSSLGPP